MIAIVLIMLPLLLGLWLLTHRHNPSRLRVTVGVLLSLSFLLIGINVQARWLFFMAGILLASIALSFLVSLFSLRGLEVRRSMPSKITEGEAAQVELSIANTGRVARRFFLLVERGAGGEGQRGASKPAPGTPVPFDRDVRVFVPRLDADSSQGLRVPRLFPVRGVFTGGNVALQSGGWIGLAASTRALPAADSVTVLPRYVEPARVPALEDFALDASSPAHERTGGSGPEFCGIREYRRGDPLRHVHWRSTARAGQLMVREFERQPGSLVNVLVLNQRGCDAGPPGDTLLDNAARIAASLLFYSTRTGRPSSLAFARGDRVVTEGSGGFEAAVDELARLADDGELSPEELFRQVAGAMPAGSTLVVVAPSRGCDPAALARSAPAGLRLGLVLLDSSSFREEGPSGGSVRLEEPEGWGGLPPPGFSSYLSFRKGDELESCLRDSWIITSA